MVDFFSFINREVDIAKALSRDDEVRMREENQRAVEDRLNSIPTEYGNALVFPSEVFEVVSMVPDSFTFTAPDGFYLWVVNLNNQGTIDTILVGAECGGGAASIYGPQGRLFAIDALNFTLIGGPTLNVGLTPASYEAEEPFDVQLSVTAVALAAVAPA